MRPGRLAAAGAALYLIFLALTAPADMAPWLADKLGAPGVALVRPAGSLWRGQAGALELTIGSERHRFAPFKWRLHWLPLLRGQLAAEIEFGDAPSHGVVMLGRQQLRLEDVQALLSLSLLRAVPTLRGHALQGQARLRTRAFALGPDGAEGEMEVDAVGVASPLSPVNPLGDYRLRLTGTKDGVAASLATLQGPLRLEGSGTWSARTGLRFAGNASAAQPPAGALEPVLRVLGPERGGGVHAINIETGGAR